MAAPDNLSVVLALRTSARKMRRNSLSSVRLAMSLLGVLIVSPIVTRLPRLRRIDLHPLSGLGLHGRKHARTFYRGL